MKLSTELHGHLVTWLKANAVNVNNVPHDALMTYENEQLTTEMYLAAEGGGRVLEPGDRNELARTTETFAVTAPPPDVAWWLRRRCPTCGR